MKVAALRRIRRGWHIPSKTHNFGTVPVYARHGCQQRLSIGMPRMVQHFLRCSTLHDASQIHHTHFMREIFHHS